MYGINAANLEFYLSGGASNADPDLSLGDEISSTRIQSQSSSALAYITGVSIVYASGNPEGIGTLAFDQSAGSFTWTPFGGSPGTPVVVTEDGLYAVFGNADVGMVCLDVDFSSLPAGDESDAVDINNVHNTLYDDLSKSDSFNGHTDYRCYYVKNSHPTESFLDAVIFIGTQPAASTVAFAADPAGVGDGVSTGVAGSIPNETTAPTITPNTFSTANTLGAGFSIGALGPGECQAIWLRRVLPSRNTTTSDETTVIPDIQAYY